MFLTTQVTVCVCHAELKSNLLTYLLIYHGAKRIGDELTRGRNVHKSRLVTQSMHISRLAAYGQWRRSVVKIGGGQTPFFDPPFLLRLPSPLLPIPSP